MTNIKFGDRFEVTASPLLIILLETMLENWVTELSQKDEIDLERECFEMAQRIVVHIASPQNEEAIAPQ